MFFLKELPSEAILLRYAERFPDMDIDKTRKALQMMRDASLLMRTLEAHFRSFDLSMTRFLILIVLDRKPETDPFSISDLVRQLDISKPVVTDTVQRLAQAGLIDLEHNRSDGRQKLVSITQSGKNLINELLPGYYRIINRHVG